MLRPYRIRETQTRIYTKKYISTNFQISTLLSHGFEYARNLNDKQRFRSEILSIILPILKRGLCKSTGKVAQ